MLNMTSVRPASFEVVDLSAKLLHSLTMPIAVEKGLVPVVPLVSKVNYDIIAGIDYIRYLVSSAQDEAQLYRVNQKIRSSSMFTSIHRSIHRYSINTLIKYISSVNSNGISIPVIYPSSETSYSSSGIINSRDLLEVKLSSSYIPESDLERDIIEYIRLRIPSSLDYLGYSLSSSIFPSKQSLPARIKAHVLNDSVMADIPARSLISGQTYGSNSLTADRNLINALCVFLPIDEESYTLAGGEIHISSDVANEPVSFNKRFSYPLKKLFIKPNTTYRFNSLSSSSKHVGILGNGMPAVIDNIGSSIDILDIDESYDDSEGVSYTSINTIIHSSVGNSRIISSSGIKGVTLVRNDLGFIKREQLPAGSVVKGLYSLVDDKVRVGMVVGPNSCKAGMNTVRVAQALLACKLGLHTCKTVDVLDVELVNRLASMIPAVDIIDARGHTIHSGVHVGLVQFSVTELCSNYSNSRLQSFGYNSLRHINVADSALAASIVHEGTSTSPICRTALELSKVYFDRRNATYSSIDEVPVYTYSQVRSLFSEDDLIQSSTVDTLPSSRILDTSINGGFYIYTGSSTIRIPSASVLRSLCSRLNNGHWIISRVITCISSLIEAILSNLTKKIGASMVLNNGASERYIAPRFYSEIQGVLFRNEYYGSNYIRSFLNPAISGVSGKQMYLAGLPDNTVVIMDSDAYCHNARKLYPNTSDIELLMNVGNSYPVHGFAIRNPSLWASQVQQVNVISKYQLMNIIDTKFLHRRYNNSLILVSRDVIECSHSDIDGDAITVFIPNGDSQISISSSPYVDPYISKSEFDWNTSYIKRESSSSFDFSKSYELYNPGARYDSYFKNSANAKNAVGSATNNIWVLSLILEVYMNNGYDIDKVGLLSKSDMAFFDYMYTRIVEERVINAIKHVENGALSFMQYYLKSIYKLVNKGNKSWTNAFIKKVVDAFDFDVSEVNRLVYLIHWAGDIGLLESAGQFLRMYNKGEVPLVYNKELFKLIASSTYLGELLAPVTLIKDTVDGNSGVVFNPLGLDGSSSQDSISYEIESMLF